MSTRKFKVGDKVRVRNDIDVGSYYDTYKFNSAMGSYKGCSAVIKLAGEDTWGDYRYNLDIDGGEYNWSDGMLEPCKDFTKSDLKDGMVVEYRHGECALYINDRFVGIHGSMPLREYDDNLTRCTPPVLRTSDGKPSYDIMKVYNTSAGSTSHLFDDKYLTLVWEREEDPQPKYKVGDRVKFRDDLASGNFRISAIGYMKRMAGEIVTITEVHGRKGKLSYKVDCGNGYYYSEDMFEGLVAYKEMTVAEIEEKLGYKVKIVGE